MSRAPSLFPHFLFPYFPTRGSLFKKCGTPCGVRTPVEAGDLTAKRVLSPVYHPAHCIKAAKKGALRALTKRSSLRGRTKVAKVGPPRARVKSAKVAPAPYV